MNKAERIDDDRNIKWVSPIVADGQTVRVPMTIMDGNSLPVRTVIDHEFSNQVSPNPYARTLPLTDSEFTRRSNQIDAKNKALGEAWKDVAPLPLTEVTKLAPTGDVYERRDRRLEDAWRGGA